jgi:hydrogenase expression/formation protein HypE
MTDAQTPGLNCPLPFEDSEVIRLGHGSGGKLSQQLFDTLIKPALDNPLLAQGHDAALLPPPPTLNNGQQLAFTTDSFVVNPLFFPGGNIGSLAVYGTINDLAMAGAKPAYLSCSLIIEEGFSFKTLHRIIQSLAQAARETGVQVVTGDTKVVERGKADGIYINTSGIGFVAAATAIAPSQIRPGDAIVLSGDIGRHGMAIMASRHQLTFEQPLQSDCAPLWQPVASLLAAAIDIHCLRDLTRGGLASALVELSAASGTDFCLQESALPIIDSVASACELLGLDPLHVANEGRFVAFVPERQIKATLEVLRQFHPQAMYIGTVEHPESNLNGLNTSGKGGRVILETTIGTRRLIDRLAGDQLPRIC